MAGQAKVEAWLAVGLLGLAALGCGVIGFVDAPAGLAGLSYWAAETATPIPTVTIFLGTTTPVYADTPVPGLVTGTIDWTTVTPALPGTPTPLWVTTTPVYLTETPPSPATTTPGLPLIGFTTPVPTETPYYRVGTFYMNSDVYIGGPDGFVVRVTDHDQQSSPRGDGAVFHYITLDVTNYTDAAAVFPASDLFFFRHVQTGSEPIAGRWTAQNEPLIARGLPSYDAQQLDPILPGDGRTLILGFVLPAGMPAELGLITNWDQPIEGGLPVWFYLQDDPLGPLVDAHRPPPPTPVVLGGGGYVATGGSGGAGGAGMWPTTGSLTRGFGCHAFYTGIAGAGFGCPATRPWFHNGVDVANSAGTAVWSPVDGTLLYAGPNPTGPDCSHIPGSQSPHEGLGNYQRLSGGGTVHYFGHLSSFVLTGGTVTAGQTVAGMGSTGCSTGSHLHWTLYQNGQLIDPAGWAGPGPTP